MRTHYAVLLWKVRVRSVWVDEVEITFSEVKVLFVELVEDHFLLYLLLVL